MADPDDLDPEDLLKFLRFNVHAYFIRPVDSKALCSLTSRLANAPFTRFCPDNLGWMSVSWNAYAAKQVKLIEISEFGCTVRTKKPLRVGTTIFLHGFIYKNAPDESLCARLYHYQKDPHEDGDYLCHFLYFGIDDSFLKYTRSWVRENYASKKSLG